MTNTGIMRKPGGTAGQPPTLHTGGGYRPHPGSGAGLAFILSRIATLAFGAPPWVKLVRLVNGLAGLFVLTKTRKGG